MVSQQYKIYKAIYAFCIRRLKIAINKNWLNYASRTGNKNVQLFLKLLN